jgi:hypothetical protein
MSGFHIPVAWFEVSVFANGVSPLPANLILISVLSNLADSALVQFQNRWAADLRIENSG